MCYVPLGNYMAHIFTTDKHWRMERWVYKLIGINPETDQKWSNYVRSMLAFSLISVLFLYGMQRLQQYLLLSEGMNVPPALAWNTAASFVTNTNWQNYSGESTMGYLTQMTGLAVQNFLSAAVGIVVAIAMVRGFIRSKTDKLGNFWVDTTRVTIRLPDPTGRRRRHHPDGRRRHRQHQQLPHGDDPVRSAPDDRRRAGGFAGGHQGCR